MKKITYVFIIGIILIIGGFTLSLFYNDKTVNEKTNDNQEKKEDQEIEQIEELIPNYKVYVPPLKDKCDIDNCVCKTTFSEFLNYLHDNDFELIEDDSHLLVKKNQNLIQLDIDNENTIDKENEKYKYVLNRYTTTHDIEKVINNEEVITYSGNSAKEIAVLNYHFFYDKQTEKCNETICLDTKKFEEQLNYLKENNYKTLTMEEFKKWMYQEIELPEKSVLLTVDDGAMGTSKINGNKLIPLLEKYQLHATLFLITGWWNKNNYQSDYLDIESHGNLVHEENYCSGKTRGAKLLCLTKEEKKKDLEKSINKLGSNMAFCFPFYAYDNQSIEVLKELDFKLAFVGGGVKAKQSNNKYLIPRYVIYNSTSLKSFINMIS